MRYRARGGVGYAGGYRPVTGPRCKVNMASSTLAPSRPTSFHSALDAEANLSATASDHRPSASLQLLFVAVEVVVGSSGRKPHRNEVRARQW